VAANSADHTNTFSRFASPDFVATTAPMPPAIPAITAPRPSRTSPARAVATPAATAARASSSDGTGERTSSGGSAMYQAIAPSATPAQPICFALSPERAAAMVAALTPRPPAPPEACSA
jgi:hypothetical protein